MYKRIAFAHEDFMSILNIDKNTIGTLQSQLSPHSNEMNKRLEAFIEELLKISGTTIATKEKDAMKQAIKGGKNLRSFMSIELAKLLGASETHLIMISQFAVILEAINAGTLVHDDIVDNDKYRRAEPSVWTKYGVPMAIYLGNKLQSTYANIMDLKEVEDKIKGKAMKYCQHQLQAAFTGQIIDSEPTENRERINDEELVRTTQKLKTGRVFRMAMVIPAILLKADQALISILEEISDEMGVLYQMINDYLDICGSKEKMGKDPEGKGDAGSDCPSFAKLKKNPRQMLLQQKERCEEKIQQLKTFDKIQPNTDDADQSNSKKIDPQALLNFIHIFLNLLWSKSNTETEEQRSKLAEYLS